METGTNFELDGAAEAEGRVEALGVVEVVDVAAHDPRSVVEVGEGAPLHALVLEAREEALGDSVVPAVTLAAHAADEAPGLQSVDVLVRAVGAPTVRVVNEPWWRFPAREGGTEGLERERGVVGRTARPADDTPGEQVQNGGEVHPAAQRPERRHVGDPDPSPVS